MSWVRFAPRFSNILYIIGENYNDKAIRAIFSDCSKDMLVITFKIKQVTGYSGTRLKQCCHLEGHYSIFWMVPEAASKTGVAPCCY